MDARLKKLLIYYAASALSAAIFVSGAVITETYVTSLADTLNKFQTLKINSIKMKEASKDVGETIGKVSSVFPSYDKTEAMEGTILTSLDSIKSRMKSVDITVANFEKKDDEIELPVTMLGPIGDYVSFINYVRYLQSLSSPLFYIEDLTVSNRSDEKKEAVYFEVKGKLKIRSMNMGSGS